MIMDNTEVLEIISVLLDEGYDAITLIREYPNNEKYMSITAEIESPIDREDFSMVERIQVSYGVNGRLMPTFDSEGNPASIMVFDNG